ncbi:MAG: hypothetical protein KDB07_02245, partial [Planctomycetes bacterium]|nr:hypothetical protein [Planctomycetota bacterium]
TVESKKHARYLVAVWGGGAASHIPCKSKKSVQNELRKLMLQGIALKDIAVYAVEPFALQVSVRI